MEAMKKIVDKERQKLEDQLSDEIEVNQSQKQIIRHLESMIEGAKEEVEQYHSVLQKLEALLKEKDDMLDIAEKKTSELSKFDEM